MEAYIGILCPMTLFAMITAGIAETAGIGCCHLLRYHRLQVLGQTTRGRVRVSC